jgi:hypothetical protein
MDIMKDMSLEQIAYQEGLNLVTTTKGANGYPSELSEAIIGMQDFEEAEKLAEKYGLKIVTLHTNAGWQFYEVKIVNTSGPLEIRAEDYGDNYSFYEGETEEEYYKEVVCERLKDGFDTFEKLQEYIEDQEAIIDEIGRAYDYEFVVTYCNRLYETIEKKLMEWSHDGHTYVIGLVK